MSPLLSPLSYRPYCVEYQVFEYYLVSFDLRFERSNDLLEPPPDVSPMTTFPLTWLPTKPKWRYRHESISYYARLPLRCKET